MKKYHLMLAQKEINMLKAGSRLCVNKPIKKKNSLAY